MPVAEPVMSKLETTAPGAVAPSIAMLAPNGLLNNGRCWLEVVAMFLRPQESVLR